MANERVLVVDDEPDIRELVENYLQREGMVITQAEGGVKAVELALRQPFDLIVLDIMMRDLDGFEVLRRIRSHNPSITVLLLSARQEDYDKILGLGLGADDYITKPFSPGELTARVKAHIRRNRVLSNRNNESPILKRGNLCLDLKLLTLTKNHVSIDLSARELKLLKFFMENPSQIFTKTQVYRNVWENDFDDDNSVMVYISRLREKIEDNPREPLYIQTVWGLGYKFEA